MTTQEIIALGISVALTSIVVVVGVVFAIAFSGSPALALIVGGMSGVITAAISNRVLRG